MTASIRARSAAYGGVANTMPVFAAFFVFFAMGQPRGFRPPAASWASSS